MKKLIAYLLLFLLVFPFTMIIKPLKTQAVIVPIIKYGVPIALHAAARKIITIAARNGIGK